MERDFLGLALGSKNLAVTVKGEAVDTSKDSALTRHSEMQLSFSNKDSTTPQLWSFKASQDDKLRTTVHQPMVSSGLMPVSTSDAFDSYKKHQSVVAQKNIVLDGKAGNHCAISPYGQPQFDACSVHHSQEVRVFPVSSQPKQTSTVFMHAPVLQSHFPFTGHNGLGNFVKTNPQALGVVSITAPVLGFPNTSPLVGSTDLRNTSKSTEAPAQLTIFYAGSVCVYDDVSPEKAEAIMLLAGNGSSTSHGKSPPSAQLHVPIPRPCTSDVYVGNKSLTTSPCSSLRSPISVISHVNSQPGEGSNSINDFSTLIRNKSHTISPCSGLSSPISAISRVTSLSTGGPNNINDLDAVKPANGLASLSHQTEPPKLVSSAGPAGASLVPRVAVPQARKASLARFLEKRKERVMTTLPYNVNNKSLECSRSGSESFSISITSTSSNPLPATH